MGLWDKLQHGTPEAALRRAQAKLTIDELAEKSKAMAENIIRPGRFYDEVRRNADELIHGTDFDREQISGEIVRKNPGVIPDHVDDPREIAGLILEIAKIIQEEDKKRRESSN